MFRRTIITVALLSGLPAPGSAQDQDARFRPPPGWSGRHQATLYRERNFAGPAVSVQRAEANLGVTWPVQSIRVQTGRWQICTGPSFTGRCDILMRDVPVIAESYRRILSIRPVYDVAPPRPPGGGGVGGGTGGQSLRGMAAEFFPNPRRGGVALECRTGTAACAKQTADAFCRSAGWNGSRNAALRTVARRNHVVDVLCVRSGY
ncbi:beta/gamma crystallin-related protein [Sphingomonas sanxanigenens]|uniref:Beta/gamma crystallin 'Greek key' domain-containing protein n=1 Tax=Sphingomonas sanxanigenens DSM 19645 = NX02 TaxID=1123269 RepID=W0AGQ3_9SPHN|nr:beta/gamma crystallin-related protein [Sphingomonas sanxanigenens]AHE55722.1 hypothetical protein NX02_20335 [Sphingomonas sanxanigenens DSM 19645 = NX02]